MPFGKPCSWKSAAEPEVVYCVALRRSSALIDLFRSLVEVNDGPTQVVKCVECPILLLSNALPSYLYVIVRTSFTVVSRFLNDLPIGNTQSRLSVLSQLFNTEIPWLAINRLQ
jgi:hypothetical protein